MQKINEIKALPAQNSNQNRVDFDIRPDSIGAQQKTYRSLQNIEIRGGIFTNDNLLTKQVEVNMNETTLNLENSVPQRKQRLAYKLSPDLRSLICPPVSYKGFISKTCSSLLEVLKIETSNPIKIMGRKYEKKLPQKNPHGQKCKKNDLYH